MATLILSAAGTAIGGPIGATIGSVIGSQIDAMIFGPPDREGPRLQELKVTTSSYGAPIPRHFGKIRAAGSIIWATDLKETSEESGGKGQPTVTTYSYSGSFAVALSSRRINGIGRIWADGNLLRGAAGDLKVGGELRVYNGEGDQLPDPLIASAEGNACPAYRSLAYCVFEELQLADFGNRIPSLTFEIFADDRDVALEEILGPVPGDLTVSRPLESLKGYSDEGGTILETLSSIDRVYPISSNAGNNLLSISSGEPTEDTLQTLPEPVVDISGDDARSGRTERRKSDETRIPAGLRYYDIDRDFQTGLQRAGGRATPGRNRLIEFPGALLATNARKLADDAAERARWSQDRMSYRIAEIDPALTPGQVISVPARNGKWRIDAWEWREQGIELDLVRMPQRKAATVSTDTGRSLPKVDNIATATSLEAYELPWDGMGPSDQRRVYAAASSFSAGWSGAALYAVQGELLSPIGTTGSRRSIIGELTSDLSPAHPALIDRHNAIEIQLDSTDFLLASCTLEELVSGKNRALIGEEIVQFANAENIGAGRWRLSVLLRGIGGSEHVTFADHTQGAPFILLDDRPIRLDNAAIAQAHRIAAIGLADDAPVIAEIGGEGSSLRPLTPVHGEMRTNVDGSMSLIWTRRARGSWVWSGTVEVPLVEQSESYEIGLGDPETPRKVWAMAAPEFTLDPPTVSDLQANHPGQPLWVRQIGTFSRSLPLLLTTID
ncbi:phage tail protein [Aurantiacibacter sediminis]|uniref:Phage tail protein n=1 Tax=Aurantiacibacter sediminis TaxID=2793064 RepID=A0ABS0N0Q0_9SPHN|nr:phage tail protein [Aurantiacibacter sediminis]MBH5321546.1 phage tail protein [Aurantiacibacter sediminis]